MEFSTQGFVETKPEGFVKKFISPGIEVATIKSVELVTAATTGNKGVKLVLETAPEEALEGKGRTADVIFYLSESAWPHTKRRISNIADALKVREKVDAIKTDSEEVYVKEIAKLFTGKKANWKFAGKEIPGKEGKQSWWKAEVAFFDFVESVGTTPSTLRFDKDRDMTRLPKAEIETADTAGALPF